MYNYYFSSTANTMKCIICVKESFKIFSSFNNPVVDENGYLYGICFDCYDKVPEHIPIQQIKKWLYHEMQNL